MPRPALRLHALVKPTADILTPAHLSSVLFQVVLINAIKDVAKALSDLISATKGAASKPADDPSMYQLKGAAKVGWGLRLGMST